MAVLDDNTQPTERSPLLAKDSTKPVSDGSLGALPNGPVENGAMNGDIGGAEAQVVDEDNPLLKGMPEMAARLHWLLPAVGIGVMSSSPLIMLMLTCQIFLSAADQTIIVSSYGKIGSELNALNNTSWIATSYFLTLTSFQPLYGKLSDIFGRKPALLSGYTIFGLGCLLCGMARTLPELVAARSFAGIGGGGMTTVVSIMMSDIIPLRERGTWQGYINLIYAAGAASGAPLGGIFADVIGWRWAFIVQAPMCLAAFIAVYFILNLPKIEETHWKEKLRQVDFLGAFCLVLAVSSLLIGLDRGSNYAWNDVYTIVPLSLAIPFFAIFLFVEKKIATNPFAPGHIILERTLTPAYLCNFFAFGGYISTMFYIPLFFQVVDGLSATQAGVRLIPSILCSVTGSLSGGIIMQKTGQYYILTIFAYSMLVLGNIFILCFSGILTNSTVGIIAGLCTAGLGGGIGVTTSLIALISNASPKDQAVATACSYLFRSLGSVIGLALSATVVQQALRIQLRDRLDSGHEADKIVERVRQSLDYIKELEPEVRDIVRLCYQRSTAFAFGLTILLVSGAVVSACFIREKRLK